MAVTRSSGGANVGIELQGLREVDAALRILEPKMRLGMLSRIRGATNKIARDARTLAPSRTGDLRAGIRVKRGTYREASAFGYKVVSDTKQGAILELAGATSSGRTKQGESLIRTADSRWGRPGRFLYRAWEAGKGTALASIEAAVRDAERYVQQRIDRGGR